jgi:phage shock protein E
LRRYPHGATDRHENEGMILAKKSGYGSTRTSSGKPRATAVKPNRSKLYAILAGGAVALAALALVVAGLAGAFGSPVAPSTPTGQSVHQAQGGTWTNVTPDRLAQMLENKDFTFVNVKTPYIGEIDGTDLFIPYDQLSTRASELPQARNAKILVYCRSGAESAQAAQTLLDLHYTNVWNLDGGMNAWTSSGRALVHRNRT